MSELIEVLTRVALALEEANQLRRIDMRARKTLPLGERLSGRG